MFKCMRAVDFRCIRLAMMALAAVCVCVCAAAAAAVAQPVVLETVAGASTATFTLTERLFGSPKTVVGSTADITGSIRIDPDAQQWLQDRQIHRRILQATTPGYEHIAFRPTRVVGLPAEPSAWASFQLLGELTIRDITQAVTFDMKLVLAPSATGPMVIVGTGSAEVTRGQFELEIPRVLFVADVSDEVALGVDLRLAADTSAQ